VKLVTTNKPATRVELWFVLNTQTRVYSLYIYCTNKEARDGLGDQARHVGNQTS